MFKLITTLSALTLTTSPVIEITTNAVTETNIFNLSESDSVNLSTMKLKPTTVDLANIEDDEEEIKWYVLLEILDNNNDIENLEDVILDILINPDGWKITGIKFEKPSDGETISYKAKFVPINNSEYSGILNAAVDLTNSNEIKDLNDVIKVKNLGTIENPTEEKVLERIQDLNKVNMDDIIVNSINYSEIRLIARTGGQYVGSTVVEYQSDITFDYKPFDSGELKVSAYNSTQTDFREDKFTYNAEFGLGNLKQEFNYLNISWSGKSMIDDGKNRWEEYPQQVKQVSLISNREYFWNRSYSSINKNHSFAYVDINEKNLNELEVKFYLEVEAYASWINAYWSYAAGQLKIDSIWLS